MLVIWVMVGRFLVLTTFSDFTWRLIMTSFYQQLMTSQATQDAYWRNMALLSKINLANMAYLDKSKAWNNWWTD